MLLLLLSHFSCVQLCATPQTAAQQAPLSLGFSRQEHWSGWRHNRRMQLNATGFRDPSTEAHIKAMKVLVSFIILFILYFVGTAIQILSVTVPENKLLFIFGMTTTILYPCGHSFILILGNSKLKQASLRVLKLLKC